MSFYTGRHRQDDGIMKRQCHITANPQNLDIMQGVVVDDTVFHTDIKYQGFSIHKFVKRTYPVTTLIKLPNTLTTSDSVSISDCTDDTYLNSRMIGNYFAIPCSFSGNKYVPYAYIAPLWSSGIIVHEWTSGTGYNFYELKDTSYVYSATQTKLIGPENAFTTTYLIIMDFSLSGQTRSPFYPYTDDILMKTGTFNVNGIDVAKMKYVTFQDLNSIDSSITIGNKKLILVNSIPASGSLAVSSKPTTGTQVTVGVKNIIDSTKGNTGMKYDGPFNTTFTQPRFSVGNRPFTRLLLTGDSSTVRMGMVSIESRTVAFILGGNLELPWSLIYRSITWNNLGHLRYNDIYIYQTADNKLYLAYYPHGSYITSDVVAYGGAVSVTNVKLK